MSSDRYRDESVFYLGAALLLFVVPPVVIYKVVKSQTKNKSLPLIAAVGLPLGYFAYNANKRDREFEQRKQAAGADKGAAT